MGGKERFSAKQLTPLTSNCILHLIPDHQHTHFRVKSRPTPFVNGLLRASPTSYLQIKNRLKMASIRERISLSFSSRQCPRLH